jgi:hypothetical protein
MIGFSAYRTGLPDAHLHIAIHGFAFWKFAKPAHEHNLQILPTLLKPAYVTK